MCATLYWSLSPRFHRRRLAFDVDRYEAPIDPLRIVFLDPRRISLMTGRSYPHYPTFLDDLGSVRGGAWDRPTPVDALPISDGHAHTDPALYHAPRFEDTVFHQSMVRRFRDGVAWEDTTLFQGACDRIERGQTGQWRLSRSKADVREIASSVDELFDEINTHGYKPPHRIAREEEYGYLRLLENQIQIDIGRDGEPRFVDGRHRLSIAKLLEIDEVPVTITVRHAGWMAERDRRYRAGETGHFDFAGRA